MRFSLFISSCFALWGLLLSPAAALAGSTDAHSRFAGVYVSHRTTDAKAGPFMNLSLGRDGTATVTEDPGNGTTTLFGHWVDTGSQVTVTFDSEEGKPAEPRWHFSPATMGCRQLPGTTPRGAKRIRPQ